MSPARTPSTETSASELTQSAESVMRRPLHCAGMETSRSYRAVLPLISHGQLWGMTSAPHLPLSETRPRVAVSVCAIAPHSGAPRILIAVRREILDTGLFYSEARIEGCHLLFE